MMTDIVLIKKALESVRIMDESPNNIRNFLLGLVTKVHVIAGQAIEDEDILNFTVSELQKDLVTRFKGLTIREVELALTNGAKGDYGEYYGLNIKSFNKFLNDYQFSSERLEALQQKNRIEASKRITAKGGLTKEESERLAIGKALDDFNFYKSRKVILDLGCTTYLFLVGKGLLRLSNEEKWELFHEAEKQLAKKRQSRCKPVYEVSIREKESERNEIIRISKNLALKRYFNSVIDEGVDFEMVLKSKDAKQEKG